VEELAADGVTLQHAELLHALQTIAAWRGIHVLVENRWR
jgi:hypothetical protein